MDDTNHSTFSQKQLFKSINSTTGFGLIGPNQVDHEFESIYPAVRKLRSQLITIVELIP